MAAITRWVQYDPTNVGMAEDGRDQGCKGTRGFIIGTSSVGDDFTISAVSNRLYVSIDGESIGGDNYITLYSGAELDPRFVARDITEKLHNLGKADERWDSAVCRWENSYKSDTTYGNSFKIYSGTLGSSSSVTIASGTNSVHTTLGFGTSVTQGGTVNHTRGAYTYTGTVSISGTYYGLFDETYKVVVTTDSEAVRGIDDVTKGGSNTYDGTLTTGGVFNATQDITYTLSIDCEAKGTTVGAGTGYVPTMSWTSTGNVDDSDNDVELLYGDHWYNIGTKGLMVMFSDAVFNTVTTAWTIPCYMPDFAQGSNTSAPPGLAEYAWSSDRGDMSTSTLPTASGNNWTRLGARGLTIKMNDYVNLGAGDEFYIICSGPVPDPADYNITSLNYGNVTVSTESDVKTVLFEVESGAIEVSTVKFSLQSHGTFEHHSQENNDTYFRFGTVGPKNLSGSGDTNAIEWYPNIVAGDIDSDTPPSFLHATKANLQEVSTADTSEVVGNLGLVSDPMWLNIRLGTSETGANSSINQRLYFDYS